MRTPAQLRADREQVAATPSQYTPGQAALLDLIDTALALSEERDTLQALLVDMEQRHAAETAAHLNWKSEAHRLADRLAAVERERDAAIASLTEEELRHCATHIRASAIAEAWRAYCEADDLATANRAYRDAEDLATAKGEAARTLDRLTSGEAPKPCARCTAMAQAWRAFIATGPDGMSQLHGQQARATLDRLAAEGEP